MFKGADYLQYKSNGAPNCSTSFTVTYQDDKPVPAYYSIDKATGDLTLTKDAARLQDDNLKITVVTSGSSVP